VLAAAAAAAPAGADTIGAQGGGANNVVLVQTGTDQAWHARSHVQIASVAGDTVASTNLALAEAMGCTGCRASAVAVQLLFVTGDPSVYTPANVATAANGGCNTCGTYAWQYLLQTSGPVYLSATGRLEAQQLEQEIADAVGSIDPTSLAADEQLTSELDTLTARLKSVVDAEVQTAGVRATGSPAEQVRES
jgi:hypothetical protein